MKAPVQCPRSWHFVTYSKDVPMDRPHLFKLFDKEYVFFRGKDGTLTATSSRCAHMGVCLSSAKVKEGHLTCPLHAWEYDVSGQCVKIPAGDPIPSHAKLTQYPVFEKWGLIFFFNHPEKDFDFPFFEGMDPDGVVRSDLYEVYQDVNWYVVPANAFDVEHFIHVHKRHPLDRPLLDLNARHFAKIEYKYNIEGSIWGDRLMRLLFGKKAGLHFVNWTGNLIFATTSVGSFQNRMLIFIKPITPHRSVSQIFVFRGRKGNFISNFIQRLVCQFQGRASQAFFSHEARDLKSGDLINGNFVSSDKNLVSYLRWLGEINGES